MVEKIKEEQFSILMSADEKISQFKRILIMEKYIMLPIKLGVVILSFLFLDSVRHDPNLDPLFLKYELLMYILGNLVFSYTIIKIGQKKFNLKVVQDSAFFLSIIDNLFLSCLILYTGGLDSPLYWACIGLMVRTAINFPMIQQQGIINGAFCLFYVGAVLVSERETGVFFEEVFILRVIVLVLISICCWGIGFLSRAKLKKFQDSFEMTLRSGRLAASSQLAGQIAHGIRNPLSIINNSAYFLQKNIPSSNQHILNQLKIIRDEVNRANKIMTDLVNYSKLMSSKITQIEIHDVFDEVMKESRIDTVKSNITIRNLIPRKLPHIYMDKGQFKQVMMNIILNSFDSIGEREGEITVSALYDEKGSISIIFEDNGAGIPARDLKNVFTPFFSTKKEGTGLGMAIVKNIVESYNGSVSVTSEKGKGTRFEIVLPVRTLMSGIVK